MASYHSAICLLLGNHSTLRLYMYIAHCYAYRTEEMSVFQCVRNYMRFVVQAQNSKEEQQP